MSRSIFLCLNRNRPAVLVFLGALMLAACSRGLGMTPESVVLGQLEAREDNMLGRVRMESVEVLQTIPFNDAKIVLASYITAGPQSGETQCLDLYETHRQALGWRVMGGGGGCGTDPSRPISLGLHTAGGGSGLIFTAAYGRVFDPQVDRVAVTFADGQRQEVPAANGSYAALRTGQWAVQQVDALNASGETIYTFEPGQPGS